MQDLFFYLFATMTLLCGLMVVFNPFSRNPVTSAMFLVLTIIGMAGLFVLLHAFFLAAVQVVVYAGAVIVLFLFVIMLLDLREEQERRIKKTSLALGVIASAALAGIISHAIGAAQPGLGLAEPEIEGGTHALGYLLFTKYLLPFEIMSILLLVAMVGVILISKKTVR